MATLSKETTEAPRSSDLTAPQLGLGSPSQSTPNQLHSDAVSLEVPIKVHGSRVTEVVRGITPLTAPFEEETTSMIVFPHGGVLRMATAVNAGQMLVLTNLKSRQDAICRVVKVRTYSNAAAYVEVEFTHRQPGYWGVYFASDDPALVKGPESSLPDPVAMGIEREKADSHEVAHTPDAVDTKSPGTETPSRKDRAPHSAPPSSTTGNTGMSFISIGSQEDIQPAASATSGTARKKNPSSSKKSSANEFPAPPPAAPSALPKSDRKETESADRSVRAAHVSAAQNNREQASLTTESSTEVSWPATTSHSQKAAVGAPDAVMPEAYGSRLDSSPQEVENLTGRKDWMLIAACAAALVVIAGGATLLFHHKSDNAVLTPPASVSQPTSREVVHDLAPQQGAIPQPAPRAASVSATPPRESPVTLGSKPIKEAAPSIEERQPEPSASPAKRPVPSLFGALNAHPVSRRPGIDQQAAAPAPLDAVAPPSAENAGFFGATSGPSAAVAAPVVPRKTSRPTADGGQLQEPQLLSSTLPDYPPVARRLRTEGDVTLNIVIDKSGNVSDAQIISGPPALQQAALSAVRRWKYDPSRLDGQPTTVQMHVTVRFRL